MEITNLLVFFEVENRHADKGKPMDTLYKVLKKHFRNVPHQGLLINVKPIFLGWGNTPLSEKMD